MVKQYWKGGFELEGLSVEEGAREHGSDGDSGLPEDSVGTPSDYLPTPSVLLICFLVFRLVLCCFGGLSVEAAGGCCLYVFKK